MSFIKPCPNCGQKNRIPARHLADTGRCPRCRGAIPPLAEPLDVNSNQFDAIVAGARVPILVDFWAEWCGPCRMAAPAVAQTAKESAGSALVLKVNTEQATDLASRFNIRSIPYFAVFAKGRKVFDQAGLASHEQMKSWLQHAIEKD